MPKNARVRQVRSNPSIDRQVAPYVYFESEPGRRSGAKLLTCDEVFAKLPSVPRILKDIPRPPDSASRAD